MKYKVPILGYLFNIPKTFKADGMVYAGESIVSTDRKALLINHLFLLNSKMVALK